jgi:hypothetical protein
VPYCPQTVLEAIMHLLKLTAYTDRSFTGFIRSSTTAMEAFTIAAIKVKFDLVKKAKEDSSPSVNISINENDPSDRAAPNDSAAAAAETKKNYNYFERIMSIYSKIEKALRVERTTSYTEGTIIISFHARQ